MILLHGRGDLDLVQFVQTDHSHADRQPSHLHEDSVHNSSKYQTLYAGLHSSLPEAAASREN